MKKEKINWAHELGKAGTTAVRGGWKFAQILINIIITVLLICVLTGIIVATAFTVYIKNYVDTSVDISKFQVSIENSTTTTQLYRYEFTDRTNRVGQAVELEGEKIVGSSDSTYVTYDQIPENMINAVIAIEDKRFRTHEGVDWKRTIGAAIYYFTGTDGYGGSSITQQLVKNVTGENDYSIQRKIQEIFWALDLETKMDKEEILEMYLNIVNFGGNYYGVQAAAYNYFNKDVSELTLIECAAIAGITQNPSKYNPLVYPENNAERRNTVLYEMYDQGLITQREFEEAYEKELVLNVPTSDEELSEEQQKGINSWYTDMVIDDVISDLVEQKGYTRQMASLMVYNGGLKIYTLVDTEVQATLEEAFRNSDNFSEDDAQYSAIVIDPETGDILGVVGARGEKLGNRVQSFATDTRRPSGSSIKPLSVYAQAIDSKLVTWATVVDDTPFDFTTSKTGWPKNDETWGYYNSYRGLENIKFAIAYSTNTVAVKVLDSIGLTTSYNFCREKLHMTDLVDSVTSSNGSVVTDITYASLGLGQLSYGISLRQLTAAYSIFPNMGIYNEANSYLKVTDSKDNEILTSYYSGNIAISEEAACVMNHMLEGVVSEGTAGSFIGNSNKLQFPSEYPGISVAGKTGSAGDNYDRWFIGYTPYYICGVWCGSEYNNKQITGTNPCLKVWDSIMLPLHEDKTGDSFHESANVVTCQYCKDSGKLATAACALDPRCTVTESRIETGYFIDGTQPTEYCDTHVIVKYDKVTGCLACEDCPEENIVETALIRVDREFNSDSDVSILDAQYTYIELPYDVLPYTENVRKPYYYNLSLVTETKGSGNNQVVTHHWRGYTKLNPYVEGLSSYNCICTEHFDYEKWKQRVEAEDAKRGVVRSSALDSSGVLTLSPDLRQIAIAGIRTLNKQ